MNSVLIIGDSIMTPEFSGDITERIAENVKRNLVRDTLGGSTIVPLHEPDISDVGIVDHIHDGLYEKIKNEHPDIDLILIQRGVNDVDRAIWRGLPYGKKGVEDQVSLYGSPVFCMKYFKRLFPQARIIWAGVYYHKNTKHENTVDFNEYIKEECGKLGIEFFDLAAVCWKDESEGEKYLADGLHPNNEGCLRLEECWTKFILG